MEIILDIGYPSNLLYSDVLISVPDHGIISFVGDNGCGKSTLLKTLAGIINPMRGVVPSELLNMNFMVSNYISIPEEVKVKDIMLLLGNENCNYVKNKYGNIYRFVEKLERQTVKKLSSGEKKVVEIFSSLALHKKYLLLDEASNALDITNRQFLLDALISVSQKDIVVFYVSHNLNEIIKLNGEVYCFIPKFKTIKKIQNEELIDNRFKDLITFGADSYE
jgi:ABC-type cobalamin/Fe3+-siderophores transport system ATPase subunit